MKGTNIPAVAYVNMDTETFTKTTGEPTDSDNDTRFRVKRLMDTSSETFTTTEPSDSDRNYSSLKLLMDTMTITESQEPTDSDK
ncbi:hypothetical protein [Flavobacterium nitrogenifigens]|uniref:hypothetical protein n=1 Tax=Flavobacterium nitrogenifigens TaxID=1617283 RepID=UPI001159E6FB|nr:hypothetical protein [Flavobacterium nitrogenifigens]KAF2331498.1 hypothetical protein DM397_12235 [Flavobacterium nitrogenifigens]